MQMNLDFSFSDDGRRVAVGGWTTEARPNLRLYVGEQVLQPLHVARHVRRDLRSAEPMGILAVFDLGQVPDEDAAASIHLADDEGFLEIRPARLAEDAQRLVEIGVDEVFFALLRQIAQGRLVLADPALAGRIAARLRAAPSAPRETEAYGLGVDRVQMTAAGQGAMVGWFMPAAASPEPLCALAVEDGMVVPVSLMAGSMARADLAPYGNRFRFTGRDGYAGGWRFARAPEGPVRLLVMVPGESALPGVMVPVEMAEAADLAQTMANAALGLEDIAGRARLRRSMLPDALPPVVPKIDAEPAGDDLLLVLDHDLADSDLRDVLRRLGPVLPGPLRLQLLRARLTPALHNAIEAAGRELGVTLTAAPAALGVARPAVLPGRVVYARSAALFQFDPAPLFAPADEARLVMLDPIGTVMAAPATQALRFARDLLPFALAMPGPAFFALLDQIPRCFLTEEARLRLLAEALIADGSAAMIRSDGCGFYEGKSGPHAQTLAGGGDWHAYDAESRRLIEEARAA